jgi:hypothetical protein
MNQLMMEITQEYNMNSYKNIIYAIFLCIMPLISNAGDQDQLLSGEYIMTAFETSTEGTDTYATSLLGLVLDGVGAGTYSIIYDSGGDSGSGSLTYSVDEGLRLTVNAGAMHFTGGVSADGSGFTMTSSSTGEMGVYTGFMTSTANTNDLANGAFVMTHYSISLEHEGSLKDSIKVGVADLTFDGGGNGTYSPSYSSNNDNEAGTFSYVVNDNGSFVVNAGDEIFRGIMDPAGSVFTMISTDPSEVGLYTGIKRSEALNNSDAIGAFHMIEHQADVDTDPDTTSVGLMAISLNGAGNGTYQTLFNSENDLSSGSFTYSLNPNGDLQVNTDDSEFVGIMSQNGYHFAMVSKSASDLGIYFGTGGEPAATSTDDNSNLISPTQFGLLGNYPNPFNPSTTIHYSIPNDTHVKLTILDMEGREIATLKNNKQQAGNYAIHWRGLGDSNQTVSTGVYFAQLQAGDYSKTIKMVYLK